MESSIVIEDREELIFLLSEASELEHMLMLEYLFAAFSLKTDPNEGLTEEQHEAVQRWKRVILEVATQEMLHVASVSNLLTAIGAAPHFDRPNFPQPAKYYPPGFELTLLPFGEHTLRHFVYYERPEGMEHDVSGLEAISEAGSPVRLDSIVPQDQAFATVSHCEPSVSRY
jgi:rubrerythrin